MVEMELIGIRTEVPTQVPIVLLRELTATRRVLPIFIGGAEAIAIAFALEGRETERPLTHDLFVDAIEALGGQLERVEVTNLVDSTFFAELHLRIDGRAVVVSARPSDSIALAVRVGCPIFAAEPVLDAAGTVLELDDEEGDGEPSEEVVEEFRKFIDNVNPEDFQS
ncbi:MAG: bifunctional nuclease family protein [Acidimicrobiales bacterium]|nr:bifunctional nuclease family protein [Acidimicrobiales bacterium]MCB1261142.1 bifunctional nuclease family protein [Acidimicrobiales bacterium]